MRIVILAPSVYSETACAMAAHLAESGYVPVGALAISSLNSKTLLRKLGQWGSAEVVRYAFSKLISPNTSQPSANNPYLDPMLKSEAATFRSLRDVAAHYGFPVTFCHDMNSDHSLARLTKCAPDLIVFTGGNILRARLLEIPTRGVLNVHLGLLPEIRGMSSPEWSLLENVPLGVTIHYMDSGIDTGPILKKYEFVPENKCDSLSELRHRLIAFGVEKTAEVVAGLDRGHLSAQPQPDLDRDKNKNKHTNTSSNKNGQFFVMHEWLSSKAAERLTHHRTLTQTAHG
ncbi:MAG: formyltransferase family protein [Candidatus Sulfotelmatobacter sp.]|jgi:folate-dependent phosphoribosylglycinamide formyltransferase PurN